MSPTLAAPRPTRLRRAALPARGRDGSPATRPFAAIFMRSRIFNFLCDDRAVSIPPLTEESGARSATGGVWRKGETHVSDDWKKSLPFPAHWLSYLSFKLAVLALATLAALRLWGVI